MPDAVLFDRYRLIEPAGRGGSAEVWRAHDEATGDEVAVKRLHPLVFADEAGRRRLRREFDALRSVDESHIVKVRDLHVGEREAALVLDFVPGESLAQRLARLAADGTRMAPEEALSILEDIAAALAAAHAVGIVHRDVTPGNILLTPDGEARLTDFGIAHASGDTAAVTATGLVMGTMRYLAPEQLRGGASTAASDLHSLAAIAYEMLAGRPAYEATTPVALAEAQAAGPPPIDGLAPGIDAAVRRGLALDPVDRPADVGAFVAGVAAALSDQVTTAMPAAMVGVASPSRAADAHGPLPLVVGLRDRVRSDPPRHPRGGIRGIPAPVAVVLGLVVAVGLLAAATGLDMASSRGSAVTPSSIVAKDPPKAAATPQATAPPAKGHDHKGHGNDNGD